MSILSSVRIYKLYHYLENSFFVVDVSFSKANASINLALSEKNEVEKKFIPKLFLNPAKSPFANANLNLSCVSKPKIRLSNQFESTRNKSCKMIANESLILGKIDIGGKELYQKVQIYSFLNQDILYIHAERHFIDVIAEKKVVNCVGLELFIRDR